MLRALGVNSRTQAVLAVSQMPSQGAVAPWLTRPIALSAAGAARRRARQPARAGAVEAPARQPSLLLRDHVRGTFAFNRTSLAGHAVGAVLIVDDRSPASRRGRC